MAALLDPGVVEDDVALEAIIFTGAVVNEANAHLVPRTLTHVFDHVI
jgi:hypothetical protein